MDKFEESQLILENTGYQGCFTYHIIVIIDSNNEIEGSISTVDDFVLPMIQKTTLIFRATQTFPYEFTLESDSLPHAERIEVFPSKESAQRFADELANAANLLQDFRGQYGKDWGPHISKNKYKGIE